MYGRDGKQFSGRVEDMRITSSSGAASTSVVQARVDLERLPKSVVPTGDAEHVSFKNDNNQLMKKMVDKTRRNDAEEMTPLLARRSTRYSLEERAENRREMATAKFDLRDVTNLDKNSSNRCLRKKSSLSENRKTSYAGESVKNVCFRLDDTAVKDGDKEQSKNDLEKCREPQRRQEIRRSSAHAVLVRHRKLSRQLSSADWEELTRDSVLRRFSEPDSDIWSRQPAKFSQFRTTQVKPLHGFCEGRSLLLEGKLQKKAFTFSVNIQSGPGRIPYADVRTVLLMFNPLLQEKRIVCNSFLYGDWGVEEIWDVERLRTESELEDFPFHAGGTFKLKITIQKDHYAVYVNNRHLLDYRHRLTVDLISYLRLEGDASYSNIECPMHLELPYLYEIPSGLRPGHVIVLDSFIWKTCKSFEIQLSARQQEVYALFVTHTTFSGDITRVQCSAFLNCDHSDQVFMDGHLSLNKNQEMAIKLIMDIGSIQVYVNNQHFADYEHHLPLEKLTQLSVSGDIYLYGINVKRPQATTGLAPLKSVSRCCDCIML